jgi:hypothetical protein
MRIKSTAILFIALLFSYHLQAQHELNNLSATGRGGVVNTFANDYQAIGVNPANLGRRNASVVSFTLMESGVGIHSKAMSRSVLRKFLQDPEKSLTQAEKERLASLFTNDNVLNLNLEINTVALSVQHPKLGGIAVSNRHRVASHIGLNKNGAEVFFLGKNAPVFTAAGSGQALSVAEAFSGSGVQASYLNEWNLAYGRQLISLPGVELSLGAGYRYIQGIGVFDFTASDGQLIAYHSLSPVFRIDYGRHENNPAFNWREPEGGLQPVGRGHGFDAGVSAEIKKKFRLALSVTDIGSMRWNGNLLVSGNRPLQPFDSEGASSYDFFNEGTDIAELFNKTSLDYEPVANRIVKLPTRLRTGLGFKAGERVEVGLDYVKPLNDAPGNLPASFVGLGVDYRPAKFFRLSSGITTGGGDHWNLPLGIGLIASSYEIGVGTRDILGIATSRNLSVSVAAGFLRFRFGKASKK